MPWRCASRCRPWPSRIAYPPLPSSATSKGRTAAGMKCLPECASSHLSVGGGRCMPYSGSTYSLSTGRLLCGTCAWASLRAFSRLAADGIMCSFCGCWWWINNCSARLVVQHLILATVNADGLQVPLQTLQRVVDGCLGLRREVAVGVHLAQPLHPCHRVRPDVVVALRKAGKVVA